MFSLEVFREILSTINKNRLRTFLTGFSVAWGIFILIILLGAGKGLENGIRKEFEGEALNSIWIWGQQTSMPFKGLKEDRNIHFKNDDYERTKLLNKEEIANISSWLSIGNSDISYKKNYGNFRVQSMLPSAKNIEKIEPYIGRFINQIDILQNRKVIVIGNAVNEALFKDGEEPLGKYVNLRGYLFKVIGVFKDNNKYDNNRVYIPISVAQSIFRPDQSIHEVALTTHNMSVEESTNLVNRIRKQFAAAHTFNPEDQRAIGIANVLEYYEKFQSLFKGIAIFVAGIGILTIIAGVVGVSNIMIISVNERTKEIGIRKAIGATPGSIIFLIMIEAILITSLAGYLGLVAGIGVLELASANIPQDTYFINPSVDIAIAIKAVLTLVVGGAIAGFYPARKASMVKPIVALRDE